MPKRRQPIDRSNIILMVTAVLFVLVAGFVLNKHSQAKAREDRQAQQAKASSTKAKKQSASASAVAKKTAATKTVDWTKPSQTYAYPTVTAEKPVVLTVNLAKQRVYITQSGKRVYTMYCSTGMKNTTPRGTFHVIDRGQHFYNPKEKMGANYWTSFKGTNYLFHSVPTDKDGKYIASEAKYLGKKPSSHGCVRLSIPDAKWINEKIPTGTKVVIK